LTTTDITADTPPREIREDIREDIRDAVRDAVREERAFFRDLIPVAGIDSEAVLSIVRAGHFLQVELGANVRRHGLSEAQVNVLVAVEDLADGLTIAQIARRMLVSRAGMVGVVRGLEARGLVACRPCPEDARALRVRITPAGQAALDALLPAHLDLVGQLVGSCFTRPEKEDLVRLLTRLREHLAARRAGSRKHPRRKTPPQTVTRRKG
jgi:DNA-binding MarR family transcriptional regulator